ncbi:MAG: TIGR01244 family sulfur transferase [Sphingomonadaceae bacterium]|uniref:TIGR01244 family sulfur transferase n=1 Tax=Thermaurantiacus sp. TaxID=2820283 RepID=UPI00298EEACB|nr:TIGR01244 family sulfur transferase [Thermaurantiacus sp.]MCS6986936.1 TIGR01244 family sulfur transferase [Sphingomonadaceae bacterium]MDW8415464.1 TIGR01244 family sulfur transferase [Thermaurantiacus sp.]
MSDFRFLTDRLAVSPQLSPADVAQAAATGFALIINNRPDGEAPDQPPGADIAAAAQAAGLSYAEIPIGRDGIRPADVAACAELLREAPGSVLMFCRSGSRSAHLATLATARLGGDWEVLIESGRRHGYALEPLAPACRALAAAG